MATPPGIQLPGSGTTFVEARNLASRAIPGPGVIEEVKLLLGTISEDVGTAFVAGAATPEVEGATIAASSLIDGTVLLFILAAFLILVQLRFFENLIIWVVGKLPWKGHDLQVSVKSAFTWLDNLENTILEWLGKVLLHMLHGFIKAVVFSVISEGIYPASSQPVPRANNTNYATENEVQSLERQINDLRRQISGLQFVTGTDTQTLPSPNTLLNQMKDLHSRQDKMQHDINQIRDELSQVSNTANSTANRQVDLTRTIHEVRAISVGWSEYKQELDNLGSLVTSFVDETAADLEHIHRVQRQMSPLGLLLQPGLQGLKNLRQLEDTPCMCPKPPKIHGINLEMLPIYEFLTNG